MKVKNKIKRRTMIVIMMSINIMKKITIKSKRMKNMSQYHKQNKIAIKMVCTYNVMVSYSREAESSIWHQYISSSPTSSREGTGRTNDGCNIKYWNKRLFKSDLNLYEISIRIMFMPHKWWEHQKNRRTEKEKNEKTKKR